MTRQFEPTEVGAQSLIDGAQIDLLDLISNQTQT